MKFGKTIKIFLIDGDPNGRMSCELSNWTGKAYKIPRVRIKDCSDRSELSKTGIYLLLGRNEIGTEQVYIGEAESVLERLPQHKEKDFWNEAIVFISKDENLNKAHIKYLENRLHSIAKSANRYKIENGNTPTQSAISESDKAEMEEFLENIKLLVNTLGHKVFEEKREAKPETKQPQEVFQINSARGSNALGVPTSEGFVVFKGSRAATNTVPSFPLSTQKLRQDLIEKGVLSVVNDCLEFTDDYIFGSPSTAAAIVMGRNANGLIEWKTSVGRTLKGFEADETAFVTSSITKLEAVVSPL
ncbi:GIY-YIG nuclease family protein [Spirosoma sp. KCTC 42546]|uniref:GIY-YIG nuclease family protein n=1 Tax=Spirosoma sp. KCTC 42546 TaxID=2520506 RepID=UPI00115B898D|nr:GIY-YIG nuclease family protein [Spirosoma sp. KCTC 42546]QDK79177.1 GIY-YIG nuclease family protein [Spirosoma sp. KCTC 42546]